MAGSRPLTSAVPSTTGTVSRTAGSGPFPPVRLRRLLGQGGKEEEEEEADQEDSVARVWALVQLLFTKSPRPSPHRCMCSPLELRSFFYEPLAPCSPPCVCVYFPKCFRILESGWFDVGYVYVYQFTPALNFTGFYVKVDLGSRSFFRHYFFALQESAVAFGLCFARGEQKIGLVWQMTSRSVSYWCIRLVRLRIHAHASALGALLNFAQN